LHFGAITDGDGETMTIWTQSADRQLALTLVLRRVDRPVLTSPLLPDFALPLDDLFR
jgi:hypothetical protein